MARKKGDEMTTYGTTSLAIFAMMIYGIIAIFSTRIFFDWAIAGCIVLFIFVIETIANFVQYLLRDD